MGDERLKEEGKKLELGKGAKNDAALTPGLISVVLTGLPSGFHQGGNVLVGMRSKVVASGMVGSGS